ncbi:MAG: Response regulator receiver domain protein [Candidatus Daviesbacteria bacterium GW2011_GWA2_40_9]|uniref:Response regulator receiver domain protein n=1 Tax=Candidatus Daviesbacteria bacterium GW2011_GWA2_40_9 TaxID=1618424 RepID=A0A0G0X3X1_9BACT|nr:MAG: Response regulator receiver domain protein [Candidatus Daviesbacteria bacterium GW2011_GWA2_40_9]
MKDIADNQKKILLIEDENFIADIYARELTKAGFDVKIERDGIAGAKALEEGTFDLLLLDIMLPGMHGLELLRKASYTPKQIVEEIINTIANKQSGTQPPTA